ncbi:MAG: FtsX-like permease family protein [Lachnospiraceae bacterium]|jgi:putative ABC transport system permease protein
MMLKKLIWNDVRQNKLMSAATVFFMTISAALLILTSLLLTNLIGTINSLMDKAMVPDMIQMHVGEVDERDLSKFARSHSEVQDWQLCRFLNLDNSQIVLGGYNMADSTQDNGLSVQSERFDFLLGMDGGLPEILPGEVYVPICYKDKYGLMIGDEMTMEDQRLIITGFIRDAQMNAMMASSKRFLVNIEDYERLREQGQEEYLIEFLLREGTDPGVIQTAYTDQRLPSNGPVITRPLIRMINALSDGMMIFVIFLVSVIVLLISMLCIHFILSIQMERDRKEMGMLKALGVGRREIRRLYFTKYLLFSLCGALLGLVMAMAAQEPLARQLRELYGAAKQGVFMIVIPFLAAFVTEGIILLSIRHSLRKTDRLSPLDAMFQARKKEKGRVQYILIGIVTAACTSLMLIPNNLYHTMSDPSFVTYMGIGNGQVRIDVRQTDNISGLTEQIAAVLKEDAQVEKYAVLQTGSYPAVLPDGSKVNLTVEAGDHLVFPVSYSEGMAPALKGEIALSTLNAEELELSVGDTLQLLEDGIETDYTVCGIYSDITNGGKTAKISGREIKTPVIWSVLYVSLEKSVEEEMWMERYWAMGVDVVNIADYVQDTYAQTLTQLRLASRAVVGIGVLVIAAVLGLFSRLIVERSRYTISLCKALGFTGKECERKYFISGMNPVVIGAAAGLLLGCPGGEGLCGVVLKSFGASGFRFVIDPVQVLAKILLIVLGIAALAIWIGVTGIKHMKAYECCMGKE